MHNSGFLRGLPAMVSLVAICVLLNACGQRPATPLPPVGQTILLHAVEPDTLQPAGSGDTILLRIQRAGLPLDQRSLNPLLFFYSKSTSGAELVMEWADLENAWQDSQCSGEGLGYLGGPGSGSALLCDGRIDFTRLRMIKAIEPGGRTTRATSWTSRRLAPGLTKISITLDRD